MDSKPKEPHKPKARNKRYTVPVASGTHRVKRHQNEIHNEWTDWTTLAIQKGGEIQINGKRSQDSARSFITYANGVSHLFSPLELPLPVVTYSDGKLSLERSIRPFAISLNGVGPSHNPQRHANIEARKQIASFLVNGRHGENALMPHAGEGGVFFGVGTTCYLTFKAALEQKHGFSTIFTENFEVALLAYFTRCCTRMIIGPMTEIHATTGEIRSLLEAVNYNNIAAAFISCRAIDRLGNVYSDASPTRFSMTEKALACARRVVLIAENGKLIHSSTHSFHPLEKLRFPRTENVILVTDKSPPAEFSAKFKVVIAT